jgi:hypothetical protein
MSKHKSETKVFGGKVDDLDKMLSDINAFVKAKKGVKISYHNTINPVKGPAVLATVIVGEWVEMSSNETNPLSLFSEIMEQIREKENKGVVPHISIAEGRIGRDIKPELVEYIKRVGNRDRLAGNDSRRI